MDLRLRCQQSDKDWSIRQKTRAEEIAAVSEAIGILSDDDAFDLFDKTVNSFVQLKELKAKSRSRRAASVLRGVAKKTNNVQLMALASKVQLDAFVKVKKAIDEMTAALTQEQADEVKHRDFCVDELNSNELQTAKKNREIHELTTLIEESANKLKTLVAGRRGGGGGGAVCAEADRAYDAAGPSLRGAAVHFSGRGVRGAAGRQCDAPPRAPPEGRRASRHALLRGDGRRRRRRRRGRGAGS